MKKSLITAIFVLSSVAAAAQLPNFAPTVGNGVVYGYTLVKYHTGANAWETSSSIQYGISNYFQTGIALHTAPGVAQMGYIARGGYSFSDYFKVGGQLMPAFDLNDKYKFCYLASALFLNGKITRDGKLIWVTNTWIESNKKLQTAGQATYLGYNFTLPGERHLLTPMAGILHSWRFDQPADLAVGCYYTRRNVFLYLWTNNLLTGQPGILVTVEFAFKNK